ncbi:MAG: DUF4345 domain-containing protein [Arenimonas sp.]
MRKLNIVVITIAGLGFLAFGILFLCWPDMLLPGVGIQALQPHAQAEIRAMYGGLELGLGFLLLNCFTIERQRLGLQLSLASYGGLALARAISMWMLGVATPYLWFALAWEAVIAALALLALRRK